MGLVSWRRAGKAKTRNLERCQLTNQDSVIKQVPYCRVQLPLASDDSVTRTAVERYAATIRASALCPQLTLLPASGAIRFKKGMRGIKNVNSVTCERRERNKSMNDAK